VTFNHGVEGSSPSALTKKFNIIQVLNKTSGDQITPARNLGTRRGPRIQWVPAIDSPRARLEAGARREPAPSPPSFAPSLPRTAFHAGG
jgi:hypothetical protein